MGWVESGRAWGERAADWAYLIEPYARGANDALFDRTSVGPGTELLDIACGSGYAASVAACRGATVSGLDASEAMIAIARARTPAGDFRVGDMFALPFDDDHFDVHLSSQSMRQQRYGLSSPTFPNEHATTNSQTRSRFSWHDRSSVSDLRPLS